jgi:acyl-CoA synthetase (AMP-forming)/AMP-acid ligase II
VEVSLLHHELELVAAESPDRIALVSPASQISFKALDQRVSALAGALQSLGYKSGDRLSILAQNSSDYIAWHYATAKIGVIFHVLNTRLVEDELSWMLDNAGSRGLIADPEFAAAARALQRKCSTLECLIGTGGEVGLDHEVDDLVARGLSFTEPPISPDDPALMIYTSGTTGRPKGALQSHGGSLQADRYTRDAVEIDQNDVYLALMPFFHQAGLIRTRATLLAGGKSAIPGRVEAAATADAIVDHKVTFTMIASPQQNTAIREKIRKDGPEGFRNLRLLLGGGGTGERAAATIKKMCDALDCSYFGVYGQTETTGPAVYISGQDVFERPTSCGRPFKGVDIAIWNDENESLSVGETGEIVVRGPITARYFFNDTATTEIYTDDWIHTGDLGHLDEDGFLYFEGRIKELIKTGAENVYPREVEAVLEKHPAIADVAIIGLPDRRWGETVCAVVVFVAEDNGDAPTLDALRAFCRGKIGGYKIPKQLFVLDRIPRNHTGKILRTRLVEMVMGARHSK